MLRLEDECRSETDRVWAAAEGVDPRLLQPLFHGNRLMVASDIESQESSVTSDVLDEALLSFDVSEFDLDEGSAVGNHLHEALLVQGAPESAELEESDWIGSCLKVVKLSNLVRCEEAAQKPSEGDDVRLLSQIPVVVTPELASSSEACLGLVDNESNAFLFRELSESFVKVRSRHLVVNRRNRLDDDCCNIL